MGILLNGISGRSVLLTTFLDRLSEDPLNLTISLGIVFAVLILIIQLIYVISSAGKNKAGAEGQNKKSAYVDNVITQIVQQEEKELMDDYELVAVITAAIIASMGSEAPADGLVVRSIRKLDTRRRITA